MACNSIFYQRVIHVFRMLACGCEMQPEPLSMRIPSQAQIKHCHLEHKPHVYRSLAITLAIPVTVALTIVGIGLCKNNHEGRSSLKRQAS